jgi:prepilin-type N-terminal cleavage/methylation domain-containing protein
MSNAGDEGFTLTELLVTITIIGILSSIMVMGVSRVQSNSNASACKNAFQAYALGYSAYQSDFGGNSPGELKNLESTGYVDANLLNNPNFKLQNGVYRISQYSQSSGSLTIDFTASWLSSSSTPPGVVGSTVLIAGVSDTIDGRYQITSSPVSMGANSFRVVLGTSAITSIPTTTIAESSPPVVISILSETIGASATVSLPFEIYLFRDDGSRVLGGGSANLAPAACSFLR